MSHAIDPSPANASAQARPPAALAVEFAAATDIGCVRHSNQDSFGIDRDTGLLVVCDGMGGAAGGEVASALGVEHFLETAREGLPPRAALLDGSVRSALLRGADAANDAVRRRAEAQPELEGMGATLVAAYWSGERATVVNVGDSRAYLFWSGAARQITRDHSLVAEQVREGLMTPEEAERSHLRSVITRAIGVDEEAEADLFEEILGPGDILLLCSDGLTRHLDTREIAETLDAPAIDTQSMCHHLIDRAKERGGSDNITVGLMRVLGRLASAT